MKTIKIGTYLLMAYAFVITVFTLSERVQVALLGGACPLPSQRLWLYSGIGAAVVAFIGLSLLDKKKKDSLHD